jgi:hypothetical protein
VHRLPTSRSADARGLFHPAATYRELSRIETRGASGFGRPLLLAFVLGCTVSLTASGRLSVRLIADGALSFAFLPVFAIGGFSILYLAVRERPVRFARALDLFFIGQTPWLVWLIALATVCAAIEPRRLRPWIWPLELSLAIPALWSAVMDYHFFREVMARAPHAAVRDLLVYRALGWSAATAYFLGIAIWYDVVPAMIGWLMR